MRGYRSGTCADRGKEWGMVTPLGGAGLKNMGMGTYGEVMEIFSYEHCFWLVVVLVRGTS